MQPKRGPSTCYDNSWSDCRRGKIDVNVIPSYRVKCYGGMRKQSCEDHHEGVLICQGSNGEYDVVRSDGLSSGGGAQKGANASDNVLCRIQP